MTKELVQQALMGDGLTSHLGVFTDGRAGIKTNPKGKNEVTVAYLASCLEPLSVEDQINVLATVAAAVMTTDSDRYTRKNNRYALGLFLTPRTHALSGTQRAHISVLKDYVLRLANGKGHATAIEKNDPADLSADDFFAALNGASGDKEDLTNLMDFDRSYYVQWLKGPAVEQESQPAGHKAAPKAGHTKRGAKFLKLQEAFEKRQAATSAPSAAL